MKNRIKKLTGVVLSLALFITAINNTAFATSIDDLKQKKSDTQDAIASFKSELTEAINKITEIEQQANQKSDEIAVVQKDLESAQAVETKQYNCMKTRIKYMYEQGNMSLVATLLSAKNLSDFISKAEYVSNISGYDRDMLVNFASARQNVQDIKTELDNQMAQIQELHSQFESKQADLEYLISQKEGEIDNIDEQIQEAIAASEAARSAEAARAAAASQPAYEDTGAPEPSYDVSTGNAIVDRAYSWVGRATYEWGACRPGYFDCSGFVSHCLTGGYYRLGTTYTFLGWARVSDPQPGDICVNADHCGIYIGGGQMIHAPTYGQMVSVGPVQGGMIYVRY